MQLKAGQVPPITVNLNLTRQLMQENQEKIKRKRKLKDNPLESALRGRLESVPSKS